MKRKFEEERKRTSLLTGGLEEKEGREKADKDGIITVDEAYRYVSREVPRATGQEQHPVKKGIAEGQLILRVIK